MAAFLDLFYSDEDRHRVVLLEDALATAGVSVVLHTSPFEAASDPVLGVLSEHAEDWMIEQARRCSAELIWLRLDNTEMPVAARQSLALQNWPGRSADLAIAELARSLKGANVGPRSQPRQPDSSRAAGAASSPSSAERVGRRKTAPGVESGPRSWVVLAWIVGLVVVFYGLFSLAPEPGTQRANEMEPAVAQVQVESAAATRDVSESGTAAAPSAAGYPAGPPGNAPGKTIDDALIPQDDLPDNRDSELIDSHERGQELVDVDITPINVPDADACLALAGSDPEAASQVLLMLSGQDRLLCRSALVRAREQFAAPSSGLGLCDTPSVTTLAAWLRTLEGRHRSQSPPPCLVGHALQDAHWLLRPER